MKQFKQTIINMLLFIVAYLVFIPLTITNIVLVLIKYGFNSIGEYFFDGAYRLDVFACGELRTLWNTILITKDGIQFTKNGWSISCYLGANQINNTLSKFGKTLVWVLDKIEKEHCIKAFNSKK